jgi:hypothetical protein
MSEEGMCRVAHAMEEAAVRAERAADRIEQATLKLTYMLEDGYGSNALKLIELLEKVQVPE